MKKISDVKGMCHNLHFARFVAAMLVVCSHAFAIAEGNLSREYFVVITNNQLTMGAFAVSIFFFFAGFLITRSLSKNPDSKDFIKGRVIRIWPALVAVIFFSTFVLGSIMTVYSFWDYITDPQTYKYLLNSLLILQHDLPGVFTENAYMPTVNGALWTLPVEVLCYIACFLAYKLHLLEKRKIWLTIPIAVIGLGSIWYVASFTGIELFKSTVLPLGIFYMGILYATFADKIILTRKTFIVCLLGLLASSFMNILILGMIFLFPYCLSYIVFCMEGKWNIPWKLGEYSYAIYLCGFPIQQMIVQLFGGEMSVALNIIISLPLIMIAAIILYKFVEKPMVQLTKK